MSAWLGVVLLVLAVPVAALWAFVLAVRYTDKRVGDANFGAMVENDQLRREIEDLQARIDRLEDAADAAHIASLPDHPQAP